MLFLFHFFPSYPGLFTEFPEVPPLRHQPRRVGLTRASSKPLTSITSADPMKM